MESELSPISLKHKFDTVYRDKLISLITKDQEEKLNHSSLARETYGSLVREIKTTLRDSLVGKMLVVNGNNIFVIKRLMVVEHCDFRNNPNITYKSFFSDFIELIDLEVFDVKNNKNVLFTVFNNQEEDEEEQENFKDPAIGDLIDNIIFYGNCGEDTGIKIFKLKKTNYGPIQVSHYDGTDNGTMFEELRIITSKDTGEYSTGISIELI